MNWPQDILAAALALLPAGIAWRHRDDDPVERAVVIAATAVICGTVAFVLYECGFWNVWR